MGEYTHPLVRIDGQGGVQLDTHGLKDTCTRLTMNNVLTHIGMLVVPCRGTSWMVWDGDNSEQHVFYGDVLTLPPRRPEDSTRAWRCREGMVMRQRMHKRWRQDACLLCSVHRRDNLIYPCGHMDMCDGSCDRVQMYDNACPTCRSPLHLRM